MIIWLTILGMALVTYSVRVLPLISLREELLPPRLRRSLNYVPIAVLSALVAPSYLPSYEWGSVEVGPPLVAGILAVLTAAFTRSTMLTIAAGMGVMLLLT